MNNITVKKMNESKEMDSFINEILDKEKSPLSIVGMKISAKDNETAVMVVAIKCTMMAESANEEGSNVNSYEKIIEVPLVEFGLKLADTFKDLLTSTTLCFIADASGGLGSEILGRIVESCGAGLVSEFYCFMFGAQESRGKKYQTENYSYISALPSIYRCKKYYFMYLYAYSSTLKSGLGKRTCLDVNASNSCFTKCGIPNKSE